jgi:hypothetical protein
MEVEPTRAVEFWLKVEAIRHRAQAKPKAPEGEGQGYYVPIEIEEI